MRPRILIGIAVAQSDHEGVSGGDGLRVFGGDAFELGIVAVDADQAVAGGFVEGNAEFHLRDGVDDGLVEILDGLDEVAVAHDDVAVLRRMTRRTVLRSICFLTIK